MTDSPVKQKPVTDETTPWDLYQNEILDTILRLTKKLHGKDYVLDPELATSKRALASASKLGEVWVLLHSYNGVPLFYATMPIVVADTGEFPEIAWGITTLV